jgi:hypothetical protein
MGLSSSEMSATLKAARALKTDAPPISVEEFIGEVLTLNSVELAMRFPDPDPASALDIAVSELTNLRESILRDDCTIPNFVVFQDAGGKYQIGGLSSYLASMNADATLIARLTHHLRIRKCLQELQDGHHLEAVAAAIMSGLYDYGEATRGSGDQGIDAIGWKILANIEPSFSAGNLQESPELAGEKVYFLASSKAAIGNRKDKASLINPAHIRELVGGWLIQRTGAGIWSEAGLKMLSPIQMILVTTYRLSAESKEECRKLGVQVWGIPELVFLICKVGPPPLFAADPNTQFSAREFKKWWSRADGSRISPPK